MILIDSLGIKSVCLAAEVMGMESVQNSVFEGGLSFREAAHSGTNHRYASAHRFLARGDNPNLKKTLREFGLIFWRPTNSESRSESCSENRVFTQVRSWVPFLELLREYHGIPRVARIAPKIPWNSESCSENGLFTPRAFFFKIGVGPRFLKYSHKIIRSGN